MADLQEGGSGENIWSRRNVLGLGGWLGIIGALNAGGAALVAMLFPRVLFEPPTSFKVGPPAAFNVGEVSERYMKDYRVWIVREETGFYALSGICTHLGCTPRWLGPENKFKCPCHGSGFRRDGTNFEGPAPRPLERVKIVRADDGQIQIDKAVKFRKELGEWTKPGSYLKFSGNA
ncbi:MAG TPA: Rieske 2Fe-2S domain-containing protein [Myxococcales bacterium]|nr:Rieske 2Fe-2S domain-containing protein [Myxococcales bacterium]